jgi:TRAP transporter TAXI family solute receptor
MALAVLIAGAGPAAAQVVGLGTNPQGTLFYNMGAAIAKVVTEKAGLQTRVLPIGGTSQLMPQIGSGETEFGLFSAIDMIDGYEGKGSYPEKPVQNLRAVAALGPLYFSLFVRNDSPAKTLADTKGMRLPSGFPAALVVLRATKGLLANPGYTMNDYVQQPVANLSQASEAFKNGRVDIGVSSIGAAALRELNQEVSGGIRYLPISDEPGAIARMQKEVPVSYPVLLRPAPAYVGVREPITVMAFDIYLATRDATPPDLVAKFAATLHANKDDLVASFPGFRSFEPGQMAKEFPVPYHPGATRFYAEKGQRPGR